MTKRTVTFSIWPNDTLINMKHDFQKFKNNKKFNTCNKIQSNLTLTTTPKIFNLKFQNLTMTRNQKAKKSRKTSQSSHESKEHTFLPRNSTRSNQTNQKSKNASSQKSYWKHATIVETWETEVHTWFLLTYVRLIYGLGFLIGKYWSWSE